MTTTNLVPSEQELRVAYAFLKGSKIPSVPEVVQKLNAELGRPEPNTDRIIDLVSQDQAITGKVLKTVNSSIFGLAQTVESISQAVVLLGLEQLRNLVVAAALEASLQVKSPAAKNIWRDSLDTAKAAMRIASDVDGITPDEAYLVGLLHDSGAVLLAEKHAAYDALMQTQANHPISFVDRENRQFGTNHTVIGYLFARHWKLSDNHCLAIYLHHGSSCKSIEDPKLRALIATLKIANHIVDQRYLGADERSFESIQYLAQAKGELMLAGETISELKMEAALGFE